MGFVRTNFHHADAASRPLSVAQVAAAYNFPVATGKGYVGGIIELGGGYDPAQVAAYFSEAGLPAPTFVDVSVDGGSNKSDGFDGSDGEVQLDMIVAASVAPGATYRVYFTANTNRGFHDALVRAVAECDGVSISWGGPENSWDPADLVAFAAVIKGARAHGVPVFVAAGDAGADDSSGDGKQVDFPSSAPDAVGCGGTRLTINTAGARAAEIVWDDNATQSATGGGVSVAFPGRQVPDIAANADPDTGYPILIDGQSAVIAGTSAVAPLMLGLHALLWELQAGKPFDFMGVIAAHPQICYDVTQGDNGGFRAGPGRDDVTGMGVPDGTRFLAALQTTTAAPVTVPPPSMSPPGKPVSPGAPYEMTGTFSGTFVGTFVPHPHP